MKRGFFDDEGKYFVGLKLISLLQLTLLPCFVPSLHFLQGKFSFRRKGEYEYVSFKSLSSFVFIV